MSTFEIGLLAMFFILNIMMSLLIFAINNLAIAIRGESLNLLEALSMFKFRNKHRHDFTERDLYTEAFEGDPDATKRTDTIKP